MANVLNLLSEETFAEKLDTQNTLLAALVSQGGGLSVKTPSDIQSIVRLGLASRIFAVGDQITCQRGEATLTWDIIGIDQDTPSNKGLKHSLTLQLHDCIASVQFDAREAFYYAEEGLDAGTYHFTVGQHTWVSGDVGKTYQFTLAQPVPAKGQLVLSAGYNVTINGTNISTYSSSTSSSAIETVQISEGEEGTDLGTMKNSIEGKFNSCQRVLLGNNNYAQSAMRQYLNSDAAAGSVWTPKNNWDRPPSWATSTAGFLNGIDGDFLAVIGEVDKITILNTVSDGGGSVTTSEKIFLLSRSEVYGGNENSINEGAAYSYYADYSDLGAAGTGADTNRIKYRSSSAQYWWLRSPYTGYSSIVRIVYPAGNVSDGSAYSSYGVAPACCII